MPLFQEYLKPKLGVSSLAFICALYFSIANNISFFKAAYAAVNKAGQQAFLFETVLFCSLTLLFFLFFLLISFKPIFKPLLTIILMLAASVSFFMDNYSVIVDASMIQNIMETDFQEAAELISPKLLIHLFVFGLLPAIWVGNAEIMYRPLKLELLHRAAIIGTAAVLLAGTVYFNYKDFSFVLRNNHQLRLLVNPNYPIYSLVKFLKSNANTQIAVRELGPDAKQERDWLARGKKTVLVLVVGETARAENFALNGYGQATNPRLSKEDIINFPNTHSCGTATAVSLPCMFSNLKQARFDGAEARAQENLLDVLKHAGINVLWLDNNSGCKGVCQRVAFKNTEILNVPGLCPDGECFDEVMLRELSSALEKLPGDTVIVLHQKGSHGPAYFKRHPSRFSTFTPECTREEVQDCSQAEIKNAYDNTILYTDYLLGEVMGLLKNESERYLTAMIYMSDHGESLGENGIYLHGLPYAFAPAQQTHIPFILWLSQGYNSAFGTSSDCLKQRSNQAYSHDNLFHSVLGLLAVKTKIYEAGYDILASCRASPPTLITEADDRQPVKRIIK